VDIRKQLKALIPERIKAWRSRRIIERSLREKGVPQLSKKFVEQYGYTVRRGPFEGLSFPEEAANRHLVSYLIGSAECELHDVFEEITTTGEFTEVVNVGSAMGHYAVGLAVAFPETPVYAFDISVWAQKMTWKTASKNDADNVHVLSECTSSWLSTHLSPGALVVSDCEGCEFELLSPSAVPALREATLVVELHGTKEQASSFVERFSNTHSCSLIEYHHPGQSAGRDPDAYPELEGFSESDKEMAVSDLRSGNQTWLYAVPN